MAQVVKGHHLKSNEYLIVRVYDEKAARESGSAGIVVQKSDAPSTSVANVFAPARVTMGELFVIKGTDVSFYIPPTGIEVVQEGDRYVRQAVTLERLEYCLLLDQNGNKRYEMGPKVVFPRPTETFVEKSIKSDPEKAKAKKFRAVELSETSGIYIKVIADYTEGEKKYVTGDELFITGRDQMIYFPRDEHAIIKYGEQEIHFGIAIPAGELRTYLDSPAGIAIPKWISCSPYLMIACSSRGK
jgi:major vault protein